MDRGAWQDIVQNVAKNQTGLPVYRESVMAMCKLPDHNLKARGDFKTS